MLPSSSPRRRMLISAARSLPPTRSGMTTRCGPMLSATRTRQPRRTCSPGRRHLRHDAARRHIGAEEAVAVVQHQPMIGQHALRLQRRHADQLWESWSGGREWRSAWPSAPTTMKTTTSTSTRTTIAEEAPHQCASRVAGGSARACPLSAPPRSAWSAEARRSLPTRAPAAPPA